jgi:hypothetical protein
LIVNHLRLRVISMLYLILSISIIGFAQSSDAQISGKVNGKWGQHELQFALHYQF